MLVGGFRIVAPHGLVVAEPHAVVQPDKRHDTIHKGLTLGMRTGRSKGLNKQFFEQLQVGQLVKFGIKVEERPASLEPVSCHLELAHGVDCGGRQQQQQHARASVPS